MVLREQVGGESSNDKQADGATPYSATALREAITYQLNHHTGAIAAPAATNCSASTCTTRPGSDGNHLSAKNAMSGSVI